ncbi:uncharacterized protein EAE98_007451 [Botrytis deweyae]|uniref:Fungal N-terminal domain-containing protein n=1 Tax=Botrytis deweyae TaxID=2478750 RepID=A0ABQ7IHM2_9HELO|nr:uncharacterized protein EAE98_007451 [Botrytis deweyae]KAF7924400.1 hypothetical protein EAE98_007451 [Botrytis deweyae]
MAEAFGVAGSAVGIISLALQLGDGILKLKSFWNAVKDAPEEILYILDELDITHVLLTEIEDSLGSQTISPAAARSLRLCQKGVDILNNAVKELEDEMKRRKKWGGVKMVMKKELLEKMEKRLGRANSLMMMAHQNYIASLSKSRHDEQVRLATQQFSEMVEIRNTLHTFNSAASIVTTQQQISNSTTGLLITPSANTTSGSRSAKTLSKYQKTLSAKLRLPFFSGVWELCAYQQSISGWDFKLRIYNVVDYDAPIMELARVGDLAGMQQLFQTRQASPYDVNIYGETILHVGAQRYKYNTCQFLIDQGVDINKEDGIGQPAWSLPLQVLSPDEDIFAIMQYLVSRADCDVISNLPTFLHYTYYFTPESMKWILQSTENPIHNRSRRERALLVLGISKCQLIHMKEIVWLTLDNMDLEACVQNLEQAEFFTLLRRITHSLGFIMAYHLAARCNGNTVVPCGDHLKDHLIITNDLFLAGSKYHHLKDTYKDYHHSFLLRLLRGAASFDMCDYSPRANASFDRLEQCLINSIETWLDQIISEGIDLIEYGQWEKKTRDDGNSLGLISVRLSRPRFEYQDYNVSLLSFIYGPKKSDWQFWFTIEPWCIYKGSFKEFWDMVEHPERQIPGAWNFDA